MDEKKWKVVVDRSVPRPDWCTRLYTPEGYEVPGLLSISHNAGSATFTLEVDVGAGFEVEQKTMEQK